MDCSNVADIETRPMTGPGGVVAVLRVHSEDDHAKDSHECMAEYHLHITGPAGHEEAPDTGYGFYNSRGEWGRRLSAHLDGFSNDGQHIFGVISEGGNASSVTVFDFRRGGAHVEIFVREGWSHLRAVKCGTSFAVAGTTKAGEIVLEPNTANQCRIEHRWILDGAGGLRAATKNDSVVPLYSPSTAQENIWANLPDRVTVARRTEAALSPSQEQSVVRLFKSLPAPWICADDDPQGEWLKLLRFSTVPLSSKDVFLVEAGPGCARGGQGSNGAMWLIRFDRNQPILLAGPEQGFQGYLYTVLKTSSKGYRDVVLGWHLSAFETGLAYFRFDGRVYRRLGSATLYEDERGLRITSNDPEH
jgi:hypothetical protein